jgi:hypothetical protein
MNCECGPILTPELPHCEPTCRDVELFGDSALHMELIDCNQDAKPTTVERAWNRSSGMTAANALRFANFPEEP